MQVQYIQLGLHSDWNALQHQQHDLSIGAVLGYPGTRVPASPRETRG